MSDRNKPHNGRDTSGHFKVRQEDFEDKLTDSPDGPQHIADDVRLGGAVEDTGIEGGRRGDELQGEIDRNRAVTERFRHPDAGPTGQR
jgi:hypothetical protein